MKHHINKLFLIIPPCLLLFFSFFTNAQNYNFRFDKITSENIKIEKGLSVNSVYCMLQDKTGYMWFGTWDGLNKFDGYKFTVYKANYLEKDDQLSNQTVRALCEDKEGNLWIGTEEGLNKFQKKQQVFTRYNYNIKEKSSISNDTILSILEDSNGNIWVGTQNGLNLFNKQDGTFIKYFSDSANNNSISNNKIFSIYEDKNSNIWFATEKGLNKYNLLNKKFIQYFHNQLNINSLCSDTISSVCQDKDGFIWVGTENGINKINTETGFISRYQSNKKNNNSLSSNHISTIFYDRKNILWIGTKDHGFITFDIKTNTFTNFLNNPNDENSLSNNNVASIYEDRSGIIWIATEKGLNKIDRNSYKFIHYQHIEKNPNSLSNNIVWAFNEDKNENIWIGTSEGINLFEKKTGKFTLYQNSKKDKNSISGNNIRAIINDKDGNGWVGTFDSGVDKFVKTQTGSYEKINFNTNSGNKNSLPNNTVWCLKEDKKGNIWIGTNNGLCKYDKTNNEIKIFKHNSYNPFSISNNIINVIYEDKSGVIWIGTYKGLNRYDNKTDKFLTYKHIPKNKQSLSSNRIFGILEDSQGTLWIGTMDGGLNSFNRKTGLFKHYTEKDGLANNMVYCILEDDAGNLWMTTNNGISKFKIKTETFVNYDIKDGVQSSEFNQNAALKTKNGFFYLGGMNGFNAFDPLKISQNNSIPPIVITCFKKFNIVQEIEINNNDTLLLSYKDNFFSFEFSSLDYSNPVKNSFAYKLENFDKNWIFCDADRRFAEYTKISPGKYIFRVKGTNSDGVWNKKGVSVVIIISPPWWATWSFKIFSTLFLIFFIWFTIRKRFKQIRKKHEIEKKVLEIEKQLFDLEQKSLRLQMNPHFIFNSLNSIQSFIINNDSDKAILYLAKFAQLMRLILSNSSEAFVAVKDELKALTYYMDIENLRFGNKFEYLIKIDTEIDDDFVGIPPMIIQPYVENAILHGIIHKKGRGKISINLSVQDNSLMCSIEDDGVGREKAAEMKAHSGLKHKSKGMIITKERLEILNKQINGRISVNVIDLKNNEGLPSGTRVEIIIPFKEI